jgi:hypothetical protein
MPPSYHRAKPTTYRRAHRRTTTSDATLPVAIACIVGTALLYAMYLLLWNLPFAD